jgi:hypothetical protein
MVIAGCLPIIFLPPGTRVGLGEVNKPISSVYIFLETDKRTAPAHHETRPPMTTTSALPPVMYKEPIVKTDWTEKGKHCKTPKDQKGDTDIDGIMRSVIFYLPPCPPSE